LPNLPSFSRGRYSARLACSALDLGAAQRLRGLAFGTDGPDRDGFDDICAHVLIHERGSGTLVCCFRMLVLAGGAELSRSYSAQFYELSALRSFDGPMVELGR